MKTLFIIILLTVLSFSLQVIEQERKHDQFAKQIMFQVRDDCGGGGGGGSSSPSSSSSSQSNKTKQFFVTPNFIQCLKNTTAVPISIINSISNKTYIFMTEDYEYVTSGYSQMTLNKINARFKFCAIVIEKPPATRAETNGYPCGSALGVTECFIEHLSETDGNDLKNAYYDPKTVQTKNARAGTTNDEETDSMWKDLIVSHLDNDPGCFVNCLEKNNCTYYFGYYLGYYNN